MSLKDVADRVGFALILLLASAGPAWAADASPEQVEFFERKIRPLLMNHCFQCHGGEETKNNLRVDSRSGLLEGGESGAAIMPNDPEQSLLIQAVRGTHPDLQMPPESAEGKKLSDQQVADLTAWIQNGAAWPEDDAKRESEGSDSTDHWSFRPISDPPPPDVKNADWAQSPIDRFILAALEERDLKPVGRADKRALIRRATFDLIGLPPTPEEVADFLADESPDAFEKLVDRLLASEEYGRRWGRHWLDLARYADTAGDTSDYPIPEAYLYRDYVVDAFNNDLPYDQFIKEQIAGDIMAEQNPDSGRFNEQVIATGFIALSRQFGPGLRNEFHLMVEDTINTLGESVLALTVGCARCHDHKFDPISAEDYYSLYGYFQSTLYPHAGSEEAPQPGGLYPLTTDPELRKEFFQYTERRGELGNKILQAKRGRDLPKSVEEYQEEMKELLADRPPVEQAAFAVRDADPSMEIANVLFRSPKIANETGDAHVQLRGEWSNKGDLVPRGFVSVIAGDKKPDIPEGSSGRLQLAQWIASPDNPLTARVMVNRIWLYHFGKAIVSSPNNFGVQGKPPTHPELLDHLASRFIESGWSIKEMHRRIMNSAVYQLASTTDETNASTDAGNEWYWRFDRHRLDAESLRDAMMAVSGTLDYSTPGPHPFPSKQKWGNGMHFTQHNPFKAVYPSNHRTVYLMTQRLHDHPFLGLFDGPDTSVSTPQRRTSTVPLQALFMMNGDFMREQAQALAERTLAHASDDAQRFRFAHELTWSRPPTEEEVDTAWSFLDQFRQRYAGAGMGADEAERRAWTSYARVLLSSNEFAYVD